MSGGARVGPIKPDQDTSNYLLYSSVESIKTETHAHFHLIEIILLGQEK